MTVRVTGRSSNVQDRRGLRGPILAGGGIGAVVIALLVMFLGGDPREVIQSGPAPTEQAGPGQSDDAESEFVRGVLYETEQTWQAIFRDQLGRSYQEPALVLYTGSTQSACGLGQAAAGPFYCPLDQQVYIDLSFYRELRERFGAPGDAAQAYVIAHEVGHHVQTLLGISEEVMSRRRRLGPEEGNELSVRQELQADCFAGVWAREADAARQILEPGDVEEALTAASAIGDDRMQRKAQGYVVPETFTHGTSAQRQRWFRRGLDSGQVTSCDTFSLSQP
ncbi:MAG TPA: neutral zinc metallopeptidase [Thermoanaerobaculia bacterium]|nr:neutral zinc metallopeptidase [Thermoanaerobaculia bacterium]